MSKSFTQATVIYDLRYVSHYVISNLYEVEKKSFESVTVCGKFYRQDIEQCYDKFIISNVQFNVNCRAYGIERMSRNAKYLYFYDSNNGSKEPPAQGKLYLRFHKANPNMLPSLDWGLGVSSNACIEAKDELNAKLKVFTI